MASVGFHEPVELLRQETREMHRALVSLMEELEAIDWYQQRADACSEPGLAEVLLHNRHEEIEHATMLLEWVRRHDQHFDQMMKRYLFKEGSLTALESAPAAGEAGAAAPATLGIGSMKGK